MTTLAFLKKKTTTLKEEGRLPADYISLSEFCHRELWSTQDIHGLISNKRIKFIRVDKHYFVPNNLVVTRGSRTRNRIWGVTYK
jgi:hypothetical protein